MVGQRLRRIVALLLGLTAGSLALPVQAQDSTGFLGIPEYPTATGVPFFYADTAAVIDQFNKAATDAIAKCDREAYNKALGAYDKYFNSYQTNAAAKRPTDGQDPQYDDRRWADLKNSGQAYAAVPKFPNPCNPPKSAGLIQPLNLYLLGGGVIALNSGGGNITGVDTFTPGNFLITNQAGGGTQAVGTLGFRAQMAIDLIRQAMAKEFHHNVFVETGVQTSFGAQSFIQSFQGVSATPQGFGSSTIKENLQIPILVGITTTFAGGTPASTPLMFDVYGGITLDSWTQTLQGRESGAPGGPGFFGQNNRFTVDPTVGFGVRTILPGIVGDVPLIVGLNTELTFRPGSVVTARSPNFPSETYYGTNDPQANLAIMARIGIPIGR